MKYLLPWKEISPSQSSNSEEFKRFSINNNMYYTVYRPNREINKYWFISSSYFLYSSKEFYNIKYTPTTDKEFAMQQMDNYLLNIGCILLTEERASKIRTLI